MDPRKVPKESEDLKKVASYRTKNRFPVLSWVHPETGAALIRSSQPTVGINDKVRMELLEHFQFDFLEKRSRFQVFEKDSRF